ncbi:probable serine/threonine-protein kinase PBL28 [Lactuca sativa]|uniref:probable serine/threonine-protein kinase PBL28 n=1 Tax=Lactuca sativa TaxID=4236 RepID=UPI000CD978E9|nr:probable serine/threonine-protein kinase PBL28 [Lactuca sativa]XP_023749761.1 probable serine/threonine-protein kinase PBL28 [Lactuca sativa]
MSSSESGVHLEKFVIPLEEILSATQNFSQETLISDSGLVAVYRGQLKNRTVAIDLTNPRSYLGDREFSNQLKIISRFQHQNIIPFVGYCHEFNQKIKVSEYAVNGSLDAYLVNPDKRCLLTWADRLKICVGAARGLQYLHSGLGGDCIVIHRDVKSHNILLDDNLEAKISNFSLSILVERNQPQAYEPTSGTGYYIDPVYEQSGSVNTELDVYSFGVVLFEMLSGTLVYHRRSIDGDQPQTLINLVRRYYAEGLHGLIDPHIRDQIKMRSFGIIQDTAYQCISWNLKDRPTMDMIVKRIEEALDFQNPRASATVTIESLEYENLNSFLIPLEEIRLATRDFSPETCIGEGGFGKVYRGQLSKQWQNRTATFKRVNHNGFQGKDEFLTELKMMSSFNHENIVPFIGYCDQGDEMIIVSELARNGSLDYYLEDRNKSFCLTWELRMKICMGAARGLEYLHSGIGENRAVIHRDMKSQNILLDDNLESKICGFVL